MYEIPKPQTLDPDRPLRHRGTQFTEDDRPEAELLAAALHESCDYADQLWDTLNAARQYLLDSLPPDPRTPGPHTAAAASPTGPEDEAGWTNWIAAFAGVTSALCGPRGDSGFGLSRAREEAQARRSAPVPTIHTEHPDNAQRAGDAPHAGDAHPEPQRLSDADIGTETPVRPAPATRPTPHAAARAAGWTPGKTAAVLAVAAVALRELRPRRPSQTRAPHHQASPAPRAACVIGGPCVTASRRGPVVLHYLRRASCCGYR